MAETRRVALGAALRADRELVATWVKDRVVDGTRFDAVIPLIHEAQPEGWNAYVIALLGGDPGLYADAIQGLAETLSNDPSVVWLDHLELQRNLDMFYPLQGGADAELGLTQGVEFVQSKPEERERYYNNQYSFTGPAMRRLYDQDFVGRFIGFECVNRLYDGTNTPQFDVIHVSGFLPGQMEKGAPHFWQAFDDAAEAIDQPSGRAMMKNWDQQRSKRMVSVEQLQEATVSSPTLELQRRS